MRLTDLFEEWQTTPMLISTATNGLNSEKDKLLAVAVKEPFKASSMYLNETHGEALLAAMKYHQITEELMTSWGTDEETFVSLVSEVIKGKTLFTYNTGFQYGFLSKALQDPTISLYDLSVVEQALRKGLKFDEEEVLTPARFFAACSNLYFPLPINKICQNLKMTRQPSPGQLPLERSLDVLQQLYSEVSSREVQMLPS